MENEIITSEEILSRIYVIRGKRVMLDRDLAELYRVETKRLKESVKRNIERFPEDFMFQLTKQDLEILRSQIATLKRQGRGQHSKYPPYAFSEHGILMLSSVLRSDRAIQVNINIMRAFTQVRDMITNHKDLVQRIDEMEQKYDDNFRIVFDAIRQLVNPPEGKKSKIGFKV
ncbi:MAG: ORF6N domain-containing protein [Deltaproteobacteria bacterium]|nr:ORF6N domain-containing protein [Deltaproteobacteria bacterium]MBT4262984.1 ORF6N domain-containing protein [Deltaproteobacteria bacterium]MBT4638959.1 ORF6N domain-containing protein [Deltaproteobacteria bacterium]MBT6504762.1 ORF6N domain-containing protein [Deltaproteobacteria bacterium]MBT6613640.1 ORF6N domain-containing protein [Deltaproteobacteria bacterium]